MDFPSRRSSRTRRGRDSGARERSRPSFYDEDAGGEQPGEEVPRFVAAEPAADRELAPAAEAEPVRRREPPPAPGPRRRRSETLARVLWAVPWGVFAIAVIASGGLIFTAAMIALAWVGLSEYFAMTARARPLNLVALAAAASMILAAHYGNSFQMVLAGVAFFPVMFGFAVARPRLAGITWSMAVTVFGIIWIGLPFAHAVLLRDIPEHGAAILVDVLVATFFVDTFSYIGGRLFGQRPLAPKISPNKTVEGLAVGFLGGMIGFWLAGLYQDWLSGTEALLMGAAVAAIAPVGDLFESAIKRDLDVKDSGRIIGPHGGLLDRIDAVLFTVVVGYYLALAIVF